MGDPRWLPLPSAALRHQETCAEPGDCGKRATTVVVYPGGVRLGFCDRHGEHRLMMPTLKPTKKPHPDKLVPRTRR